LNPEPTLAWRHRATRAALLHQGTRHPCARRRWTSMHQSVHVCLRTPQIRARKQGPRYRRKFVCSPAYGRPGPAGIGCRQIPRERGRLYGGVCTSRCTAGALLAGCPAPRRRRSCCLVARAMCRPWPLAIRRVLSSSRHPRSPHVITGSDARGEAAGPARRNLEESSKQSAMLPATASSFEAHDLRYEMLSFMLHIIHAQN